MGNYFEGGIFVKVPSLSDKLMEFLEGIKNETFHEFDDFCDITNLMLDYGVIFIDENVDIPIDMDFYNEILENKDEYQEFLERTKFSCYYVRASVNCKGYRNELVHFFNYLKTFTTEDINPLIIGHIEDEDGTCFKDIYYDEKKFEEFMKSREYICKGCDNFKKDYVCSNWDYCERAFNLGKTSKKDCYCNLLNKAIVIAVQAHQGQLDKGKLPYINHPLFVMNNVSSTKEKIVAVLHDVLEDTTVTSEYLRSQGFDNEIVEALELLKHQRGVPYLDYINNLKGNKLASNVKIVDLNHNLDMSRLESISEKDIKRKEKYLKALEILTKKE